MTDYRSQYEDDMWTNATAHVTTGVSQTAATKATIAEAVDDIEAQNVDVIRSLRRRMERQIAAAGMMLERTRETSHDSRVVDLYVAQVALLDERLKAINVLFDN